MTSEDVARYLREHAEFFEQHADLLASMYLPHPHGGRAIPLAERQILALRDKSKLLEVKLRELIEFGEENDTISERVHRINLELLAAHGLPAVLDALYAALGKEFGVTGVAVRMWSDATDQARAEFSPISEEARVFAESLVDPYFSQQPMFDSLAWFESPMEGLASFAYLPLRSDQVFGLLALGSTDAQRFAADKGTLYLARLAEAVSVAIKRNAES